MYIPSEAKEVVEQNPIALSTVMNNGNPNVIGAAAIKVIEPDKLLVTDVFMNQTLKDIQYNSNVVALSWNKELTGYKFIGKATYYKSGKYVKMTKLIPENADLKPKGALVITVHTIIKTA